MKRKMVLAITALSLSFSVTTTPFVFAAEAETESYETLQSEYEALQKDYDELSKKYEDVLSQLEELKNDDADLPEYDISGTVNDVSSDSFTVTTAKGNVYTFALGDAELSVGETISFKYKGEISSTSDIQPGTVSDLIVTAEASADAKYETGITYSDLSRNPDNYKTKYVKFSGRVVQLIEDTDSDEIQIRFAVDDDYDQILYAGYDKSIVSSRVLEDDYITIYGISAGLISYQSTLGGTITIPAVYIERIDQ